MPSRHFDRMYIGKEMLDVSLTAPGKVIAKQRVGVGVTIAPTATARRRGPQPHRVASGRAGALR